MSVDFKLFLPEFLLAALAFGVMTADLFLPALRKARLVPLTLVGLAALLAFTIPFLHGRDASLYQGIFLVDSYSLFFKGFFIVLAMVMVLISADYVRQHLTHPGEYYGILLFSILAMMMMAAAGELLPAYIARSFSASACTSWSPSPRRTPSPTRRAPSTSFWAHFPPPCCCTASA